MKIYIRSEDLDKWNAIEKKSEFIHKALFAMNDSKILRTPKLHKEFDKAVRAPKLIKSKQDVLKVVEPPAKNFLDKKKGLYK